MRARLGSWPSGLLVVSFVAAISGSWWWLVKPHAPSAEWSGVDEVVIGRFAAASDVTRPGFSIDWVRGDLLLFTFLWAGLISGAALGYGAHALFANRSSGDDAGARPAGRAERR